MLTLFELSLPFIIKPEKMNDTQELKQNLSIEQQIEKAEQQIRALERAQLKAGNIFPITVKITKLKEKVKQAKYYQHLAK